MKFNKNEVNKQDVETRAMEDFHRVMNGPNQFGRTPPMIMEHCMIGHYAEQYLIDNFNFKNYDKKYHDLIDPDGKVTEIKVYNNSNQLKKQLERIKNANWNSSQRFMGFLHNNQGEYTLYIDVMI